jgi:hypothetical protein
LHWPADMNCEYRPGSLAGHITLKPKQRYFWNVTDIVHSCFYFLIYEYVLHGPLRKFDVKLAQVFKPSGFLVGPGYTWKFRNGETNLSLDTDGLTRSQWRIDGTTCLNGFTTFIHVFYLKLQPSKALSCVYKHKLIKFWNSRGGQAWRRMDGQMNEGRMTKKRKKKISEKWNPTLLMPNWPSPYFIDYNETYWSRKQWHTRMTDHSNANFWWN